MRQRARRSAAQQAALALAITACALAAGCECGETQHAASSGSGALAESAAAVPPGAPGAAVPPGAPGAAVPPGAPGAAVPPAAPGAAVPLPAPPPPPGATEAPAPPPSAKEESEPIVIASSVGGRDATPPAGSVVDGLIVDTLIDIAPAGPATATARGVAMVNRANELWLAAFETSARVNAKPRATPLRSLPESAGPFPLAKGPAVREGNAYWVSKGRLLRRSLGGAGPGGAPDVLREDARVGTRVAVPIGAAKDLAHVPPLAAYVARAPAPDDPLQAKLWVEGHADAFPLSDDISAAHNVTLLGTPQGLVALYLDARTGMSSLHLRSIEFAPGNVVSVGEDRVVWVGGPSRASTEFLAQSADGSSALGLMALERDITHFGLLSLRVPLAASARAPDPDWLLYENGIEPAPFAGVELCGRRLVALARPSSAAPHAPQELVLLELGRSTPPAIVLARSRSFFSVSLYSSGQAALLSYVSDQRAWGRSLRCVPG